jgi:phage anti-repressor protein
LKNTEQTTAAQATNDLSAVVLHHGRKNGEHCWVVDGESFHSAIGVGTHFTKWLRVSAAKFGYVAGRDYFETAVERAGRHIQQNDNYKCNFTLEVAKELCAGTGNEASRRVRAHLVILEERAQTAQDLRDLSAEPRSLSGSRGDIEDVLAKLPHALASVQPPVVPTPPTPPSSEPAGQSTDEVESKSGKQKAEKPTIYKSTRTSPVASLLPVPVMNGEIGGLRCQVVQARELYRALGIGRDYTQWIKQRIVYIGIQEGMDFEVFGASGRRGPRSTEHLLTIGTAKELATLEGTDKGRSVRAFFVQLEEDRVSALAGAAATSEPIAMESAPASTVQAVEPSDLVKVMDGEIGGLIVQVVDARELHQGLGVGRDFATWIKDKITEGGFEPEADFAVNSHSPIPGSGNRGAKIDYLLALGTAKEIAMLERNARGRQVRRYFIECEKKLIEQASLAPVTPPALQTDMILEGTLRDLVPQLRQPKHGERIIWLTQSGTGVTFRIAATVDELKAAESNAAVEMLVTQPLRGAQKAVSHAIEILKADFQVLFRETLVGATLPQIRQTLTKVVNLQLGWEPEPRATSLAEERELVPGVGENGMNCLEVRHLLDVVSARHERVAKLGCQTYLDTYLLCRDQDAAMTVSTSFMKMISAQLQKTIREFDFDYLTEPGSLTAKALIGQWVPATV